MPNPLLNAVLASQPRKPLQGPIRPAYDSLMPPVAPMPGPGPVPGMPAQPTGAPAPVTASEPFYGNGPGTLTGMIARLMGNDPSKDFATKLQGALATPQGQAGADPARAMLEMLVSNPELMAHLPPEAFQNATALLQLSQQGQGTPTANERDLAAYTAAGGPPPTPDELKFKFGMSPSQIQQFGVLNQVLAERGMPPLAPEEIKTFFGAEPGKGGVTVNVGAPDMGPVLEFVNKKEVADRQDRLSQYDQAIATVQDALRLTADPNAAFFFGPAGKLGDIAGGVAGTISQMLGQGDYPFLFTGPSTADFNAARTQVKAALVTQTQALLGDSANNLSSTEKKWATDVVNDPDGFMSSPSAARGAFTQLVKLLARTRNRVSGELQQGGVNADITTPQQRPQADIDTITESARKIKTENPGLTVSEAMDLAEKRFDAAHPNAGTTQ